MINKSGIIYKATNIINKKIYIGLTTKGLEKRKKGHLSSSKKKHPKYIFHKAIAKYGEDNFIWEIIDDADTLNELSEKEIFWIGFYNSIVPNGYNISTGGYNGDNISNNPNKDKIIKNIALKNTGKKRSQEFKDGRSGDKNPNYGGIYSKGEALVKRAKENEGKKIEEIYGEEKAREIKEKLSKKNSGENNNMYGKTHTPEAREKISKAHLGTKLTEEQKKNLSIKNSGENNAFYGKKHTPETSKKLKLGWTKRRKKFICLETGVVYKSVFDSCEELGVSYVHLWKCLKNGKLCKGFHYKYVELGEINSV